MSWGRQKKSLTRRGSSAPHVHFFQPWRPEAPALLPIRSTKPSKSNMIKKSVNPEGGKERGTLLALIAYNKADEVGSLEENQSTNVVFEKTR